METPVELPEQELGSRRLQGRVWLTLKLVIVAAAIAALLTHHNITAACLLCLSLLTGFYVSFRLKQEDIEKPVQKFWFAMFEKAMKNTVFLILFLRAYYEPRSEFPTILCSGLVVLTLRNIFLLAFSISQLREKKQLPLHSFWGRITTAALNITMILYALHVESLHFQVWRLDREFRNISDIWMVISLLLMGATILGYLYFFYRDRDHRKPISVATQLTISRIILAPVFIWVFFYDSNLTYQDNNLIFKAVALIMVIFFAISDGLDGHLARKYKEVSVLGKFLDPFSDKIATMSIFLCFLASDYANVWMIALIYFREATVETLRTLAAAQGIIVDARRSGKWKTGIQIGVIITILVGAIADTVISRYFPEALSDWNLVWRYTPYSLMYGVTVVTVFSGVDYILGNLKVIKSYI